MAPLPPQAATGNVHPSWGGVFCVVPKGRLVSPGPMATGGPPYVQHQAQVPRSPAAGSACARRSGSDARESQRPPTQSPQACRPREELGPLSSQLFRSPFQVEIRCQFS